MNTTNEIQQHERALLILSHIIEVERRIESAFSYSEYVIEEWVKDYHFKRLEINKAILIKLTKYYNENYKITRCANRSVCI